MSNIGSAIILSVIIPVYNVKKHLKKCVSSLSCSQPDACEILLVDDGSSDGSGELCDELERALSNVRVIHQPNGGLAAARNTGLLHARGSYVCFVDSDDYVDNGYIDAATALAAGDDIVCLPFYVDDEQNGVQRHNELTRMQSVDAARAVPEIEKSGGLNMAWNKLYRRAFLEAAPQSRFVPRTEPGEDLIFNAACFLKAQTVTLADRPFYHWVRRGEDTLANRFRRDLIEKNKGFVDARCRLYEGLGIASSHAALLAKGNLWYVFGCVPNMYRKHHRFPRRERLAFYREIFACERVGEWVRTADTDSALIDRFRRLYRIGSPVAADAYYSAAMWGRNTFDALWQKKRKRMRT